MYFLIVEYLSGGTLNDYMSSYDGKIPLDEI